MAMDRQARSPGESKEMVNPTVSAANVPKGDTSDLSDVWQLS